MEFRRISHHVQNHAYVLCQPVFFEALEKDWLKAAKRDVDITSCP
ncbi:hypothetical protein [Segatella bryantii]|nr:hypothetical protein [Segatella bryantii]